MVRHLGWGEREPRGKEIWICFVQVHRITRQFRILTSDRMGIVGASKLTDTSAIASSPRPLEAPVIGALSIKREPDDHLDQKAAYKKPRLSPLAAKVAALENVVTGLCGTVEADRDEIAVLRGIIKEQGNEIAALKVQHFKAP